MTGFDQSVIDLMNYEGNMKLAVNRLRYVVPVDEGMSDEQVIDKAISYIADLEDRLKWYREQ